MGAWSGDSDRRVHAPAGMYCSAAVAQCAAIGSCTLSARIGLEFLLRRWLHSVIGSAFSVGAFTYARRERPAGWPSLRNRQFGKWTCVCSLKLYNDRGSSRCPGSHSTFDVVDLDQKEVRRSCRNEPSRKLVCGKVLDLVSVADHCQQHFKTGHRLDSVRFIGWHNDCLTCFQMEGFA